jgi:hypothetical protein
MTMVVYSPLTVTITSSGGPTAIDATPTDAAAALIMVQLESMM